MAVALIASRVSADALDDSRSELYAKYASRLEASAAWCDERQLGEQAKLLRSWQPKRDPDRLYLFTIDESPPALLTEAAQGDAATWQRRFSELRKGQAAALFKLAGQAADADRASLAMQLLTEVVREDPDHRQARAALGYREHQGVWRTSFGRQMIDRGNVWHERFGWLRASYVDRYEAGMRRYGNQWIDAEQDAQRHRQIDQGWHVETDHYRVTTNHSLEEGVRLARRLERLHQIWRQLFVEYYASRADLKQIISGRRPSWRRGEPHQVVYHRTRAEYNEALRRLQPKIDITLGIYFDNRREAYFFAGADQHAGTMYHEATHQLFQESRRVAKLVGRQHNFWIIEGIATYMESLTEHDGYFTLGGEAGRLPAARHRLLNSQFYVPLEKLVGMSTSDLQQNPDIAKIYSQSAGLTTFLMHADGGKYRNALVRYLAAVYTGTADTNTLSELTGRSYAQLDSKYRRYIESTN